MEGQTHSQHYLSGKSIFVIGAGVSGSAFVASLRKIWKHDALFPKITIFDRDPRVAFERRGGYSLSLVGNDASGGLIPLKKMGLLDAVLEKAISGVGGDGVFKLWSADWQELSQYRRQPIDGIPTSSVRVSRKDIRQILLRAARLDSEEAVRWDTQCLNVSRNQNGRLEVETKRGETGVRETLECDYIVVADGASSKIRSSLRPADKLEYTGAVMRMGVSRFTDSIPKEIGRDWGFVLSRTGVSCFVSPVGEKDVQWALGHFEEQASTPKQDDADMRDHIQRATELGSHFGEPFNAIISRTDPDTVMRIDAHDKMPFRHSDVANLPVVFIGDSNHALSPFAGYGANLGLSDAWDLAEQLIQAESFPAAIEAYDDISCPRATKVVTGARKRLRAGHSTGVRYFIMMFMLVVCRYLRWIFRK